MRERPPRRILVTRLRFLGDVVLSLPLLEHLRERFPEASLEYLIEDRFAPLLEGIPELDRVHVLPKGAGLGSTLRMANALRSPRIDWWIDLLSNPRSCALAWLARPRQGVGSTRGWRSRVYRHRRDRPEGDPSALRHHLDKLMPLCGPLEPRLPRLVVGDADRRKLRARFDAPEQPVLIHPGSTWPDKAWPQDRWPELIDVLRASSSRPIVVLTPPGEESSARELAASRELALAPELGIREILALLESAALFVGNDGGILHCAVALRRPTLGLFGPTDPAIWFPYEAHGPFRVLRGEERGSAASPSHPRLQSLSVAAVAEAARSLLASP